MTRIERYFFTNDKRHATESDLGILDDYMLCQRHNCLPHVGGLYDQDYEIMQKFILITNALEKKQQFDKEQEERQLRLKKLAEGQ